MRERLLTREEKARAIARISKSEETPFTDSLQLGATAWSVELFGPGDVAAFERVAKQVKKLPFYKPAESIESFASMDEEGHDENMEAAPKIKAIADKLGLRVIACGFNPQYHPDGQQPTPHITSPYAYVRREAIARIHRGIDYAAAVAAKGQGILSGPSYMRHMHLRALQEGEGERFRDIIKKEVAPYAKQKRVKVALEPLNQHEGYLLMPGQETVRFAEEVGSEWVGINGDPVHWALQGEGDIATGVYDLANSGFLFVFHLSEPHRKQWGTGDIGVRTPEIFGALISAGYKGPVDLENFCSPLHSALHIWRPDKVEAIDVLRNGARYIAQRHLDDN